MDEVTSRTISDIIVTANSHFKAPLYNQKLIQHCLKHPKYFKSRELCEKLKNLLLMIRQESDGANNYKHFWKNIQNIMKDAIQQLSGMGTRLKNQSPVVVPRTLTTSSSIQVVRRVLKTVELQCLVPFWFAAPELFDPRTVKLSEGSFGEVYRITKSDGEKRILKIIPVDGRNPVDNDVQLKFNEIAAEISASIELSKLTDGESNQCSVFPKTYRVCVVQDSFPQVAIEAWELYERTNASWHPKPDLYPEDQAFVTIETDFGGTPLTTIIESYRKAESIFKQVAAAVAIAEESFQFEHRDLHIGNILIKQCDEKEVYMKFRNRRFCIPTHGIKATIIDFTYSRIATDDGVRYIPLDDVYNVNHNSTKKYLDHRYVYAKMTETTKKNWEDFSPRTNILWMKHIVESLLRMVQKKSRTSMKEKIAMIELRIYNRTCLTFNSVSQFVQEYMMF